MSINCGFILEDDYIVKLRNYISKKHMGKRMLSAAVVASILITCTASV